MGLKLWVIIVLLIVLVVAAFFYFLNIGNINGKIYSQQQDVSSSYGEIVWASEPTNSFFNSFGPSIFRNNF